MNELTKLDKLRCSDCDALIINENKEETKACFKVKDGHNTYIICKNCGSLVRILSDRDEFIDTENLDVFSRIIFDVSAAEAMDKKNIDLGKVMKEYKESIKEEISSINAKTIKDAINSMSGKIELDKEPKTYKGSKPKNNEDSKYILLSKGHDSWKIFNSKKELLDELSKIPDCSEKVLIYELGDKKELKYKISFV